MNTNPDPSGFRRNPRQHLRRAFASIYDCLGWRLVVTLTGSLLLLLGAGGWLALKLHQDHMYSLLEKNAIELGETILSSTHFSMLENDQEHLGRIIENIGQRESVLALRLLDARGEVRHSSAAQEIGQKSDINAPLCRGCHAEGKLKSPANLRDGLQLYSLPTGEGALGLGVPVLNAPECSNSGCHVHPPTQRVLGMLDLELSTLPLEEAMSAAGRQMAVFAFATVLIISSLIGVLAWRIVHRPVHTLLDGIRRLGEGELSYRVPRSLPGEMGEVATSFNEMTARLERARAELEDWNQLLEAKVQEKSRELERTRDQMVFTEKMASLGKLAAIVAHEINNPLAGVLVYAKLARRRLPKLRESAPSPPENGYRQIEDALVTIETETARCGDLVRNLLLFSRRHDATRAAEDVNAIVRRTLKLIQHQADLSGVSIEADLDVSLAETVCNGDEIQQAMLAVVMNALEAMPDGGTLTVRTAYRSQSDQIVLEVQDTGVGIPDEVKHKIFEPFFSTKNEGKGTGLGLSVVYGIVHRHHGVIEVESEPGAGTVLRMMLPLHPPEDEEAGGQTLSTGKD